MQFAETSTVFSPPCPEIQKIISDVIDKLINTVNSVNRIVYTRPFTEHVQAVVNDAPNVQQMISNSRTYQQICNNINAKIKEDFLNAEDYVFAHITEQFRYIYDDTRSWDLNAYMMTNKNVSKYKEDIERIQSYEDKLDKVMRGRNMCGILEVESRNLKEIMNPMIRQKLTDIKKLVKVLAEKMCKMQLDKLTKGIQALSNIPHNLKEFAGYVEKASSLKAKERGSTGLVKAGETVEKMYNLLNHHKEEIPIKDKVQLGEMHNTQIKYDEAMEKALNYQKERMPEMTISLDTQITRLNEQLLKINQNLKGGMFIDVQYFEDPSPVLDEVTNIKKTLDKIKAQTDTFASYEELFKIDPPHEYTNLKDVFDTFEVTSKLWETVARWNENYDSWMNDEFQTLDVEEMNKEVASFFKDSFSMHKKLDNQVTGKLKSKADDFKIKMNTILELGNPNMKNRHWAKIYAALQ